MWPAWGYGLWAPLPGVCVRRTLVTAPFRTRSLRELTNEPIRPLLLGCRTVLYSVYSCTVYVYVCTGPCTVTGYVLLIT